MAARSPAPSRRGAIGQTPISSLPQPVRARFIRYVHGHVGAANLAISDIRVFGNAGRRSARRAWRRSTASRHTDQREATISWARVPGAVGYNIRFGIRPDRLT